jgi:integrase
MDQAGIQYNTKEAKGPRGRRVYSKGFHSLRHTTNSLLANKNVPQEQRLEIMGQASLDVNDGYTKFDRETKRLAINQLPTLRFGGKGRRNLKAPKSVESTLLLSTS